MLKVGEEIEKAKGQLTKVEQFKQNAEMYLYEYFEDIKRQVDIRREDLKLKIDIYSDELIKSIEKSQLNSLKLTLEANQISENIEKSKKDLDELILQFEALEFNDKEFEKIKTSVEVFNEKFNKTLAEYKDSLIGKKKYTFDFKEMTIEDIFGRLTNFEFGLVSTIIDKENTLAMNKLCAFSSEKKWQLLYRATRDGFSGEDFHSNCDGFTNTLTIIKSTNGNIFGGFAEKAWNSSGYIGYVVDPKAYIFSLVNKENNPFRAQCSRGQSAIYCKASLGPTFGRNEIRISSNSNSNERSMANFGFFYRYYGYQKKTERAQSILAGSLKFQTLEIEVFAARN